MRIFSKKEKRNENQSAVSKMSFKLRAAVHKKDSTKNKALQGGELQEGMALKPIKAKLDKVCFICYIMLSYIFDVEQHYKLWTLQRSKLNQTFEIIYD